MAPDVPDVVFVDRPIDSDVLRAPSSSTAHERQRRVNVTAYRRGRPE